jgi:hypothetical protein
MFVCLICDICLRRSNKEQYTSQLDRWCKHFLPDFEGICDAYTVKG